MSNFKIDPNRLGKGELTYELAVRGIAAGTVEVMRTRLAMARRLEKSGESFSYPAYPFTPEEDVTAVTTKLDELSKLLVDFNDTSSSGLFQKYLTKINHLMHRIDHIPKDHTDRPDLLAKVLSLLDGLHQKAEKNDKVSPVPPQLSVLGANTSTPVRSPQNISAALGPPSQCEVRPILPNKWNCTFSGEKKGLSLNAFLERVEELSVARRVSKETLLESGIDLFAGKAYQFYLAYRNQVSSWDEFVLLLKEEYLSVNYNERLFEEINRRTQGPDESIGVYVAVMLGYFKRLTCTISDETKLKILMRNIAPFYQSQLSLVEVNSIEELRRLGKKLEASKEAVQSYVPPTRKLGVLEPDLAYVDVDSSVDSCEAFTPSSSSSSVMDRKEVLCYRCKKPGHLARGCTLKTAKFCYRCKREGYTVNSCPHCNQQGKGNRRA